METSKVIGTPIATVTRLDMDETEFPVNQTMYRGIIGSLLYLTTRRPDIIFSVGLCARFQSNPKESHLKAAKRILRYLKGTQDLVLYYPSDDIFNLIGYADADYVNYLVDRKSTSGMAYFLGSCLISWGTRKQNSMTLSTAKAEYVAAASCCAQLLWIKQQLEDFGVLTESVPLLCDNTSALNIAKNPVQHKRTKHIEVRHHFLRDNVEKGLIYMKFCSTEDQIADIFTKALSREQFERNIVKLGLLKPN
ncbi:secreted RxLR effector protein 161-like [Nicotiana sylvestris]|uniref:secreted RxLR effector protein 161-like n=1 Tax=Nicotiana sylvestris TaxID=4096 RepID=UPI00388C3504